MLLSFAYPSHFFFLIAVSLQFYIEQLILGLVKINLSYIKGKKHSWDMSDQRVLARKNLDAKDLPNLTSTSRNKENKNNRAKSDLFRRWSQHTSDEDFITETGGKWYGRLSKVYSSAWALTFGLILQVMHPSIFQG